MKHNTKKAALKAAFPYTLPICAGFLFLGTAYGIYMRVSGFPAVYPMIMSLTIFAGSMEFVTVNLLLGAFNPIGALFLTLMVNARHLFYGISMLEKYKNTGWKKWYLIFGMCDESFSINVSVDAPQGVDRGWFMFFVTLLNQLYWFAGATLGGLFGNLIQFNAEGLEFVMTALLVVIFLDQWMKETQHYSSLIGIGCTIFALFLFGSSNFLIPSMLFILAILTIFRNPIEKAGETT
ncbi:MAG: AzlC family ABC transporter permease [Lachnospiraceae bacterium]|nr:AzlC family ABC transporter permease [Lachnospiraceae bacterium]